MADLQHQTILVTGATSGIGEATARELVRQGAHVIILARSADKAAATRARLAAVAAPERVSVALADLASLADVRRVGAELAARHPRLDGLINNAGLLFGPRRETTAEGNEKTLATNHLGHFLLTSLLLDNLRRSPAARIINVASSAYQMARPDWNDLQAERSYSPGRMYGNTKLYNILFTQELARRLAAHDIRHVTVNSVHPGVVRTGFGSDSGGVFSLIIKLMRPFLLTPEQGAATTLYLATSPEVAHVSGQHFAQGRPAPVRSRYATEADARRLWTLSEELTGARFSPN